MASISFLVRRSAYAVLLAKRRSSCVSEFYGKYSIMISFSCPSFFVFLLYFIFHAFNSVRRGAAVRAHSASEHKKQKNGKEKEE